MSLIFVGFHSGFWSSRQAQVFLAGCHITGLTGLQASPNVLCLPQENLIREFLSSITNRGFSSDFVALSSQLPWCLIVFGLCFQRASKGLHRRFIVLSWDSINVSLCFHEASMGFQGALMGFLGSVRPLRLRFHQKYM